MDCRCGTSAIHRDVEVAKRPRSPRLEVVVPATESTHAESGVYPNGCEVYRSPRHAGYLLSCISAKVFNALGS
jgi:hypothetical protein